MTPVFSIKQKTLASPKRCCLIRSTSIAFFSGRTTNQHSARFQQGWVRPLRGVRAFSSTRLNAKPQSLDKLPPRTIFRLKEAPAKEPLTLEWHQPPRNILLIKKDCSEETTEALKEFSKHVKSTYPEVNILLEPRVSSEIGGDLNFEHFSATNSTDPKPQYHDKVDLVVTFGGDGTILHAASQFATSSRLPPILSFSMGTLGFLSEWKYSEYKRAFRETYMSGAASERHTVIEGLSSTGADMKNDCTGWSSARGKSMGPARGARVLVRQRLKVAIFGPDGNQLSSNGDLLHETHAMNEVILHRGRDPHLAIVDVYVGGRFLTEAVADGMIISTPTGSTAYSLSSGGSIVHPLVSSLLLTPICPRSLSFRPLVLPATTPISLKLSEKNRGREVEVSIDGIRRRDGIGVGTELRVSGEEIKTETDGFVGGIPCIMRGAGAGTESDDGWVGGLNGLLKFNYPFGEER